MDDTWSETSSEDNTESATKSPLQSRAYQIEMFEHSMQGNIIAVMGTGTGKTQIAKLRIEAELHRSIGKRVWFTAPSVVLAYQQYSFLSKQLPAFQFRLITGMDNVDYWSTQDLWDQILLNVHVVVSTPRILLDALCHFVSFKDISLLVIDEAHHCVDGSDLNTIMKVHYHLFNDPKLKSNLPHILGLSASPIVKSSTSEIDQLEANLNAKCKTPMQQLEQYTGFVNMPKLEILTYEENIGLPSALLTRLKDAIAAVQLKDDPYVHELRQRSDLPAQEKLTKILKRNATSAIIELRRFSRSSAAIHADLGRWACDFYITACIQKLRAVVSCDKENQGPGVCPINSSQFIDSVLQCFHESADLMYPDISANDILSPKVELLFELLTREYRSTLRSLVFVQRKDTAFALAELINSHPTMQDYHAFSFVGVSNPAHQGAFDFAQLAAQNENLERFRRGEINLCVATSVLEEGIDVPAMNLVICFDERPNLRSFVQSRGRARQQESKFVILRAKEETRAKERMFQVLEAETKKECEDSVRAFEELTAIEQYDEPDGEIFRVRSTGATLAFHNARPLLQRFCDKLPKKEGLEMRELTYCIEGQNGHAVSARVYLPTSLPPDLQIFHSQALWRTERMAKNDAAYQAYLSLYHAGLLTDNLLPRELRKDSDDQNAPDNGTVTGGGVCTVQTQYDPWPMVTELWSISDQVYAHQVEIKEDVQGHPSLYLLLPLRLPATSFPLYMTLDRRIDVSLHEGQRVVGNITDIARKVSLHLLATILGRRLPCITPSQFPFLLVPSVDQDVLEEWYLKACNSRPLMDILQDGTLSNSEYLLRYCEETIPYLYRHKTAPETPTGDDESIFATKLPRRLEYLSPPTFAQPTKIAESKLLLVVDCVLLGLTADYGRLMLVVPSMTHMVEVALRSAEACRGPLKPLEFGNLDLVAQALTLPRVGATNYERLEFLGDDVLKFYASFQVFVDYPHHPENLLTIERDRLVNNQRLQKTTRSLGLDRFLTQHKFSGAQWTAGVSRTTIASEAPTKTHLSSKTLADVIEALIGVAKLDGATSDTYDAKVICALQLFLDEVQWRSVAENIGKLTVRKSSSVAALDLLVPVEVLIGYSFIKRTLLAEALTQSSLGRGVSSYERLEFLGDAILDHIVKTRLFHSPLMLDPEQMTLRRHALVSHATLAFFALQASHVRSTIDLKTDFRSQKTVQQEATTTVFLPDYIKRIGSRQDSTSRELTSAAYAEVHDTILMSFDQGRTFPWSALLHLRAPKSYSDIIESILAAVFIDSGGNLDSCAVVLNKLGFMKLLDRFVTERDLDVRHPEQLLSQVAVDAKLIVSNRQTGWRCKVMLNDERIAHAKRASCKDEAQCRAADHALQVLSRKRKAEFQEQETVTTCVQQEVEPDNMDRDENERSG
ncbi:Dicer-like protein 2 [Elasticomyces elasticus]|uniref:Dicer-like protein 2 n=1 Tax=Exophiala sideris TaxID=1016849 RepID=A0ABR0J356_9EURO|nr:Dicer-like protein 2 [Elasticomyces elasticus]KAK5024976.1 Dicer-like protein 2 [Exophiala sideris]KAK5031434.1 Dicer-like protein 2 [Exophiala sideris]KAK5055014.1 Dicer-like protein 2 [Exophiala sideris]KAK5179895.1 Dicer-like protein 2 [Eurotiomycetes sp. CCFEE 6388]